jgi:hypothetical protein
MRAANDLDPAFVVDNLDGSEEPDLHESTVTRLSRHDHDRDLKGYFPRVSQQRGIHDYGTDIYTEAARSDDTLGHLGPLRRLAGIWTSAAGADVHPVGRGSDVTGPVINNDEHNVFVERYELQPIDPQTNGPQLFYGLRYHTHIVKPGEVETFHDQVGYWLWEPAAHTVLLMLAIPRGQVLLAAGTAEPEAAEFEVSAALGSETYGILSNPFLDRAFQTLSFRMRVTFDDDGTWSYEEHTQMRIPDRETLVDHVDRNTLKRIGEPSPNPLAAVGSVPATGPVPTSAPRSR